VIKELKSRFQHFKETGDDSKIPADLQRTIYSVAVKYGGREEYNKIVEVHDKPKTPSEKISAIRAMGATEDSALLDETTKFITNKSRDQDIIYFFGGLEGNFTARRKLTKYLQDEYDVLVKRFEGNFTLGYLVKYGTEFYSSKADHTAIEAWFKNKDTSKYNQSLAQALDSIRARSDYVERSTDDLRGWLEQRGLHQQ